MITVCAGYCRISGTILHKRRSLGRLETAPSKRGPGLSRTPRAEHNHQDPTRSQIVTTAPVDQRVPPHCPATREHALLHGIARVLAGHALPPDELVIRFGRLLQNRALVASSLLPRPVVDWSTTRGAGFGSEPIG
jgi:hypothetical protein